MCIPISQMASLHIILCLLSITITFTSSLVSSSTNTPNTITIPLSPLFTNNHSSLDPFQSLKFQASSSITRAHHLKHRNDPFVKTQLHPKSYGGYSVDLKFGTPPQTFSFVLDTGSSLVWLPCSSRYLCSKCNVDATKIPKFIPKNSSTSKIIGCENPKCKWVYGPDLQCKECRSPYNSLSNCTQICPPYTIQYGLGSTAGFLLLENLNFQEKIVPHFLLGCSIVSVYQPAGIVGLGRGPGSLPAQMGLKRFSYCLLSHHFDDSSETSDLVLQGGSTAGKTAGVSYTPFQKNPATAENAALGTYYYVTIRKVFVGGKRVKIPTKLLEPDSNGNGGSIVDSGTTFTFMERPIFDAMACAFENQVNLTRDVEIEKRSGLSPCFVVSGGETTSFPELTLQFRGGAKMTLPQENYFSFVGEKSDVACLTIVSDQAMPESETVARGPAVILGNYQQQNFYVEYDLENEKFGFRSQKSCKRSV